MDRETSAGDWDAQQLEINEVCQRLIKRLPSLSLLQLGEVERLISRLELQLRRDPTHISLDDQRWPHAPLHRLGGKGTFTVTAGTLYKKHYFRDEASLDILEAELLSKAKQYEWQIEAWACFSNHYHFIAHALTDSESLKPFLSHLHSDTGRHVNLRDGEKERKVWFNFWDKKLTYPTSYFARLNYVHQNAGHHGLVAVANQYRWCSAAWFERTATRSQIATIYRFKTDKVRVFDDFDVIAV
jgi:putative transposase